DYRDYGPRKTCPKGITQTGPTLATLAGDWRIVVMTLPATTSVAFESLSPRFAAMRDYLDRVRQDRRMARPADLDPRALEADLPFINLIDVALSNDAVRYRFRLVGIAQSAAAQIRYAGRFIDDVVDSASRPRVLEDLARVTATC